MFSLSATHAPDIVRLLLHRKQASEKGQPDDGMGHAAVDGVAFGEAFAKLLESSKLKLHEI